MSGNVGTYFAMWDCMDCYYVVQDRLGNIMRRFPHLTQALDYCTLLNKGDEPWEFTPKH